jgi:beta-lactamase class A
MKTAKWVGQTILWAAALVSVAGAQTGKAEAGADLQAQVVAVAARHHGKVAFWAQDLKTGKTVELDADKPVQTASVIKLALLYEVLVEVREGKARWDEKVTLPTGYAVKGSGFLQFFDAPLALTLKDVVSLMVIVSDNTATDLMIDRIGVKAVNDRMAAMGLRDTWLYKRIGKPAVGEMPADQPKFGLGKTTAREMGRLMERIGRCQLHQTGLKDGLAEFAPMDAQDGEACKVALEMLRSQFYRDTVPRYLDLIDSSEEGSAIASKTGSLNAVRNDVAIVAGKSGPIVISAFTYENSDKSWTVDNDGVVTVAKLARAVVEVWSPGGLEAKGLVPGLGLGEARKE